MATLGRRTGGKSTLGKVTRQAGDHFSFSTAKRGTNLCHRDGAGASMMDHTFASLIKIYTSLKKNSTPYRAGKETSSTAQLL